jgi:hypothetical protein
MPKNCTWEALFRYFIMLHKHYGFKKPYEINLYIDQLREELLKKPDPNPLAKIIAEVPPKLRNTLFKPSKSYVKKAGKPGRRKSKSVSETTKNSGDSGIHTERWKK